MTPHDNQPGEKTNNVEEPQEEKSFLRVIVHSFFIIPFLIAVFCVLLFAGMKLLTQERRTAYDYLEDVKTGGVTKRWQGAFELSKILANPDQLPQDQRFSEELIAAFKQATHDDNRVRQYLALAMGRTGRTEFVEPLLQGLNEEKEENLAALIYALGMLKDRRAVNGILEYLDHPNARIRSITVVSLGNMADSSVKPQLKKALYDPEPNVQWGAAISLAQMQDDAGKEILLKLLNRNYLADFEEVDIYEQNQLILSTIEAAANLKDTDLHQRLEELSRNDTNMKVRAAALAKVENK